MIAPSIIHPWEHESALENLRVVKEENAKLKAYASYLSSRMTAHVTAVNERVTKLEELPFVAAAMLDDLDDAVTVAGLKSDPRTWSKEPPCTP